MIKKIISISLSLVVALTFFVVPVNTTHAINSPSWHWREIEISPNVYTDIPVDDRCADEDRPFRVILYTDDNFQGRRAIICGRWDDLSQLPQWRGSSLNFNNSVSSYRITDLPSASGGTYGVRFSFDKDQEGTFWVRGNGYHNEGGGDVDNKMSSLRRIFIAY